MNSDDTSAPAVAAAADVEPEMSDAAATVLAELALGVDGGCLHCAANLIEKLSARFPTHASTFEAALSTRQDQAVGESFQALPGS